MCLYSAALNGLKCYAPNHMLVKKDTHPHTPHPTPTSCLMRHSNLQLGQQFRTEFYMDRHMDNKHADKLNMGDDDSSPRCLDSLCGVLGCGEFSTDGCAIGGRGEGAGGSVGVGMMGCGACDNADMDKRRFRCKALFHRLVS